MIGLCLLSFALGGSTVGDPTVSVVAIQDRGGLIALRRADADERLDLIHVEPTGFGYRFMTPEGSYSPEFDTYLPWPGEHLAWDIVDIDGDGVHEVVTLSNVGEVRSWKPDAEGGFGEGTLLLASRSYLPHGISRMRFVRDVDGNGRPDLVLPAAGLYRIHLQSPDGAWAAGFEIEYEADIDYEVGDTNSLEGTFGQTLRIPWFSMEDVDGDGRQDLVSSSAERVDFHLARPELSATPTWTLDLVDLKPAPGQRKEIDLEDLFSNLDQGVKWRIEELDGKAPRDLVLQIDGTIKVYHGGSVRGVTAQPDQVLKISGNLLHYFLRDVTGDDLPDLQLLRGEQVGLGRVLRWLVLPGSLDFEFFTYENTAGQFSRKPTRRNTIALKIPRLLTLLDDIEEIEAQFERQSQIPAQRLAFDADGEPNDVVDVVGGRVLFHRDRAPSVDERFTSLEGGTAESIVEAFLLKDLDALADEGTRTIDLGGYEQWRFSPGVALRESCAGAQPALSIEAPGSEGDYSLRVVDLNGDGRDDVIAWTRLATGEHLVQFLVLPTFE
jgi:hypothetical protein